MTILSQIRQEANSIADSMPLEVIERAEKNLAQNRFYKLRKGKALPNTDRERTYKYHLNKYVHHKILRRGLPMYLEEGTRFSYLIPNADYWYHDQQAKYHRNMMNNIEYQSGPWINVDNVSKGHMDRSYLDRSY